MTMTSWCRPPSPPRGHFLPVLATTVRAPLVCEPTSVEAASSPPVSWTGHPELRAALQV